MKTLSKKNSSRSTSIRQVSRAPRAMAERAKMLDVIVEPGMRTEPADTALELDPETGKAALAAVEAKLRAMPEEEVMPPNLDPRVCAVCALTAVDLAREKGRKALFYCLPEAVIERHIDEVVENDAWATWHLHTIAQTAQATVDEVRVDVGTISNATQLRTRMLRVLGYHFAENEKMQLELADIRGGTSYQDFASDLARLARHYDANEAQLRRDGIHYQSNDAPEARRIAKAILKSLRIAMQQKNDVVDLRNRAWSALFRSYATLKSASDFIFRDKPAELAHFPALRTAVLANSPKVRTKSEEPTPTSPSPEVKPA